MLQSKLWLGMNIINWRRTHSGKRLTGRISPEYEHVAKPTFEFQTGITALEPGATLSGGHELSDRVIK